MKIDDLIAKLPEEYRAIAKRYAPLLINMGFEELQDWVERLAGGDWQQAYKDLVSKMTTTEIVDEQDKANEIMKALNKENADLVAAQSNLMQQILLSTLLMLRGQIE